MHHFIVDMCSVQLPACAHPAISRVLCSCAAHPAISRVLCCRCYLAPLSASPHPSPPLQLTILCAHASSYKSAFSMQGALTVRPASTRVIITPITMNNMPSQSSLSGTMPETSISGAITSANGARFAATGRNAANSTVVLTISGGSASSHHPKQLTRLIRSSHSGKSASSNGASNSSARAADSAAVSFGMSAGIAGNASNKYKGKIAKSSLARGSTTTTGDGLEVGLPRGSRVLSQVDAHAPAILPSLSTTQLNFNRHSPLNEHLQPSGLSRSLQQDDLRINQHLQLGEGQGMGVLAGMGWMRGHRQDETED